jgi:DNA-binding transcriptional ArsR family regulator
VTASPLTSRADLFRLLGDEDRLRLLALCELEELTVGELATLLGESQPQITRKSQPLRDAGLLHARRDGTRTLLRAEGPQDSVVAAAMQAGRSLCVAEGRLARVPAVVAEREETARKLFADAKVPAGAPTDPAPNTLRFPLLPMLAPLLPGHALAVDVGTGEGALLPLLSPLYDRVIAVDRSPARLARAARQVSLLGLPNVRLREAEVDDSNLAQEIARAGGADLVVLARVLHHAARPQDLVTAAARLLRLGGHLVVVDHFPHDDESLRDHGHVWLGFEPAKLRQFLEAAGLRVIALSGLRADETPPLQLAVGQFPGASVAAFDFEKR